ncbi:hypothetical protein AB6A40_006961 [Gnathostoma spinigerum]|uniref:Uncharacterized protein n=1 Tax=Gnathostoma spinigerum TaxID=75299 RepID=A0ABD6EU85_9BILA
MDGQEENHREILSLYSQIRKARALIAQMNSTIQSNQREIALYKNDLKHLKIVRSFLMSRIRSMLKCDKGSKESDDNISASSPLLSHDFSFPFGRPLSTTSSDSINESSLTSVKSSTFKMKKVQRLLTNSFNRRRRSKSFCSLRNDD